MYKRKFILEDLGIDLDLLDIHSRHRDFLLSQIPRLFILDELKQAVEEFLQYGKFTNSGFISLSALWMFLGFERLDDKNFVRLHFHLPTIGGDRLIIDEQGNERLSRYLADLPPTARTYLDVVKFPIGKELKSALCTTSYDIFDLPLFLDVWLDTKRGLNIKLYDA